MSNDIPYKALQTLRNAQIGVHLPNRVFIRAIDQYLKYLRNETNKHHRNDNEDDNIPINPLSKNSGDSLERTVEDIVTFEFVEKVRKSFADVDTDNTGYLDINEFTIFMRRTYPDITDREAQIIFMKIDTNCDGEVDLSEYLTYILFEHQEREIMYDMSKPIPYPNKPKEFTLKNLSLDLYISFQFFPGISRGGMILDEIDYTYGRYISITRHGLVSHWTISLKLIRELKIQSIESRKQTLPLWITCMCVLPDMNYFVIGTTERDLIFYDINSHTYISSIIINNFPSSLTTIDYRMTIKNTFQSAIFCGDSLGNLFIFQAKDPYKPMFHISDLTKTGSIRIYSFLKIINQEYLTVSVISFCHLHDDWIVQVKWINDLDLFVSCALTSKKSLFIGDLNKKTERYAIGKKGFAVLDYCKTHRSIVTGGNDGVIRFWDPFVTERPAGILRGHNSSITHLVIDNREDHVISIDKRKREAMFKLLYSDIIIWDIQTLKIIQRISHTLLDLSGQDLTICYLNPIQQHLILGNKKLLSLSHINESYTHHNRTSHLFPITKILYNPLFDVVISSDEGSTINIWNIKTGEKIMHILNAHVTQYDEYNQHAIEITAMCLDEAKRRLITGAHDGSLALWNFNNGHNLYRVNSNGIYAKEITALLHENERLFVAGWSRRIRVFHLGKSVVIRQVDEFRSLHNDDILSMSMMMNILATTSYDGDIILWTIETGMPFMKLNSSEDIKPKLMSPSWLYKQTTKDNIQANYSSHRDNPERSIEKTKTNLEFNQSTLSSHYHLDSLIFLHTRDINPSTATLITCGSMGWIWCWSIHVIGRLITVFNGARRPQEHVLAMCVDEKCNILLTSDTAGYVAIWFIGDYACKQYDLKEKNRILSKFSSSLHSTTTEIQEMRNQAEEKLRDHFGTPWISTDQDRTTFLSNTVIYPHLLISYRAHLRPITSIFYVNEREIILTSSIDCTIRLFTLTGRYIGFMDQTIPWGPLNSPIVLKDLPKQIPEDIRRKGSATTLEVLRGDIGKRWKLLKHTIVAWTSLPIFRFFYQNKNLESSNTIQEQSIIPNQSKDVEEKQEWIQRRQRLHQLIGLDRSDALPIIKKTTVESMLKTQRDNFGITTPILGQFVRKYMQHRSRTNFNQIQIHGGKAIIYSLLPLSNDIPHVIFNSKENHDIEFTDDNIQQDKLPNRKKNKHIQICR